MKKLFNYESVKVYKSNFKSIFKNLSIERFLFRDQQLKSPTLLFYQNDKSVIIGWNQNPWKECRLESLKLDGVDLCRRNSGGGAVYQDLGNFCFSFLTPVQNDILPFDMKKFHNMILIKSFKDLGVDVEEQGRNDLVYKGRKFSGSAFEIELGGKFKQKQVLHHGTILLNTNLNVMERYLNPNVVKLKSKGVDSIKQRVINLQQELPGLKEDEIQGSIVRNFSEMFQEVPSIEFRELDQSFIKENEKVQEYIEQLQDEKWVLGESPQFTNNVDFKFDWGYVDIYYEVDKGKVSKVKIYSDSIYPNQIDQIQRYFDQNENLIECSKVNQKIEEIHLIKEDDQFKGILKDILQLMHRSINQ